MKKYIVIFCSLLLLSACSGNKHKDKHEEEVSSEKESIAASDAKSKYSSEKLDSLALYAWGDVKFGISQKEAKRSEIFKGGDKYDNSLSSDFDYDLALGRGMGLNGLLHIWGDFIGKGYSSLEQIRLTVGCSDFDNFLSDVTTIIGRFKDIYGEPSFVTGEDMTAYNLGDKKIDAISWSFNSPHNGTKYIFGTIVGSDYSHYEFEITISNSKFKKNPTKVELEEEKHRKENERKAIKNAF